MLSNAGKREEAKVEYQKALTIYQKLADDNPTIARFRQAITYSLNSLGSLLTDTGRASEAIAYLVRSRDILEAVVKENPTVVDYRNGFGL